MDGSRLLIDMGTLFTRCRDLRQVLRSEDCEAELKERCALLDAHDGAAGMLGSIVRERPDLYEFALFSAALVLPVGRALALPAAARESLFLAALLRGTGQLQQAAAGGRGDSPLAYEACPQLAVALLKSRSSLPETVLALILNQHERYDGTGYPAGKLEPELSDADLALSLVGELVRIRLSGEPGARRSLSDCVPVLQFNQGPHFTDACRHTLAILSRADIAPGAGWTEADADRHIVELVDDIVVLQRWLQQLDILKRALGALPMSRNVARCRLVAQSLQHGAISSGITDQSMVRWAEHVRQNGLSEFHAELQEVAALQAELFYRLDWIPDFLDATARETGELPKALQALRRNMENLRDYRASRRGEDDYIVMDI